VRRRRRGAPSGPFLEEQAEVVVRFQEVDALGVVWHGHYLSYFEVARVALGARYGIDYQTILDHGYVAPLVHCELDYFHPARFGERLTVAARLHAEPGAKIRFTYRVTNAAGTALAEGSTAQAFVDLNGDLVLTRPDFYEAWLARRQEEFRTG
jgi:acyl-CoA thioester hydrolase